MHLAQLFVAAAALIASTATAFPAEQSHLVNGLAAPLQARGKIEDAMSIIERKGTTGTNFCSTFLHIPAPKTRTQTITRTSTVTVPSSTRTRSSVVTRSGSAVTRTSTALVVVGVTPTVSSVKVVPVPSTSTVATVTSVRTNTVPVTPTVTSTALVVVPVTPTVSSTLVVPVPSTSTVATITAVQTATVPVTQTVTVTTTSPPVRRTGEVERAAEVPIPRWLSGYRSATVSRACSKFASAITRTRTRTTTIARTISSGVKTVVATRTVLVTPTSKAVVSRTSTRTDPAVTAVVTSTSSSLVGVTATNFKTSSVTVTATPPITAVVSSTSTRTDSAVTSVVTATSSSLVGVTATADQTTTVTVVSTVTIAVPPPPPTPTINGQLKVVDAGSGATLGYVGPLKPDFGTSTLVASQADALRFSFTPSTELFSIKTPAGSSFPYLGAIFGGNGQAGYLKDTDDSFVNLGYTNFVAAGAQGSDSQNSLAPYGLDGKYETQIFSYDAATGVISAIWTNPDGSTITPNLYYLTFGSDFNFLEWAGDTFSSGYSSSQVTEVNLVAVTSL